MVKTKKTTRTTGKCNKDVCPCEWSSWCHPTSMGSTIKVKGKVDERVME